MKQRLQKWYLHQSEADLRRIKIWLGFGAFLLISGIAAYLSLAPNNHYHSYAAAQAAENRQQIWAEMTQDLTSVFVFGGIFLVLFFLYLFLFSGDSKLKESKEYRRTGRQIPS